VLADSRYHSARAPRAAGCPSVSFGALGRLSRPTVADALDRDNTMIVVSGSVAPRTVLHLSPGTRTLRRRRTRASKEADSELPEVDRGPPGARLSALATTPARDADPRIQARIQGGTCSDVVAISLWKAPPLLSPMTPASLRKLGGVLR
jgi:hypothetical protein